MKATLNHQSTLAKHIPMAMVMVMAMLIISLASNANAHEWTLDVASQSQKVEAKVADVNGTHVLLENTKGVQKAFPINELNDSDMNYLKGILAAKQVEIEKQQVKAQQEATSTNVRLQHDDIGELVLYAPNGRYITRQYSARSNIEASQYAHEEFPNARVGAVRKVHQRHGFGFN